ncbi:hypothetical protein [Rheinheimera sp.]|uniref:hypothetical protein n=1 Tax=Rheinheimera sp. TaxID=1869214 RepID=UPI002FDC98AB
MIKKIFLVAACVCALQVQAQSGEKVSMSSSAYDGKYKAALRMAEHEKSGKAFEPMLEYAKYGEKTAQYLVGTYYLAGIGTEPNPTEGLVWLGVALEQKIPDWQRRYDALTAKLSDEQKKMLADLTAERKKLYGAEAQMMKCRLEAPQIGSNMRQFVCAKVRDSNQRVTVVKYKEPV